MNELARRAHGEAIRDLLSTELGIMTDAALTWDHRVRGQDGTDLIRRQYAECPHGWSVVLTVGQ